jgi:hypothetical protein
VELIETDAKLEELKEFKGTFERDVILKIYCIIKKLTFSSFFTQVCFYFSIFFN